MRNIDAKFKKPYNNCNLRKIIYHQYLPMFMSIFNLMGAQTDRFRYEVFQNLFLSPMNTVFLRDAVATVLTVYGIETNRTRCYTTIYLTLQQYLPFTVLKLWSSNNHCFAITTRLQQYLPFTVLKLNKILKFFIVKNIIVATVLTVYGIETIS